MDYLTGDSFLQGLPLLLAGPGLRRTEPTAVTVWVALKQACTVKLQILHTQDKGQRLADALLEGESHTVTVGQHLHVVAVTARPLGDDTLRCDLIYAYDLQFITDSPENRAYSLTAALRNQTVPTATVSYFSHQKPTFCLPPQQLDQLRIVHGSCRKPHGKGFDTLPLLDCLIEASVDQPQERPHQLFLTGDQIYGDDVADPLQWIATALGDTLLGWEEPLPVEPNKTQRPKQLPAGKRKTLATQQAGFTAGFNNKKEKVTSHFLSFGEYCALYLLERSPVCWPVDIPAGHVVTQGKRAIHRWNQDRHHMQQFIHTLWKVRRALANIPTYTVFDDHDVSDDWNLNQEWCLRVLGRPLGRRAVQNALLAYGLFQAWGNTPWQFEPGQPGGQLLAAVHRWSASGGTNPKATDAISQYLGLPPIDPATGLPEFVQQDDVWVLRRSSTSLTWHYTVYGPCHEVLALDTRTVRGYPVHGTPQSPPMLLSPNAFEQQITAPLAQPSSPYSFNNASNQNYATFVIASTNIISMKLLDRIQAWQLKNGKVFSADVGDSWNLNDTALAKLLTTLLSQRQTVIVLSGDIHFSSAVRLSRRTFKFEESSTLIQLVSSAMKNEELLTRLLHTRLKQWLIPEKSRQWIGWEQASQMVETSDYLPDPSAPPDWWCQTQWIPRQTVQATDLHTNIFWLTPPQTLSPFQRLVERLKFWNSRWFQTGNEIVGVNNIAVAYFKANENQPATVIQDNYWFSTWHPIHIVRSRFQTPLKAHDD